MHPVILSVMQIKHQGINLVDVLFYPFYIHLNIWISWVGFDIYSIFSNPLKRVDYFIIQYFVLDIH